MFEDNDYANILDIGEAAMNAPDPDKDRNTPEKDLAVHIKAVRWWLDRIAKLRVHDRDYDEAFTNLEGEIISMQALWQVIASELQETRRGQRTPARDLRLVRSGEAL